MSATEKLIEKLPDVHFDLYARLLPGIAAAAAYSLYAPENQRTYISDHLLQVLLLCYLAGHLIQPLSGFFVKTNEEIWGKEKEYESAKIETPRRSSEITKISKAHAEAVSMFSTSALIFCLFLYLAIFSQNLDCRLFIPIGIFILFSIERIYARRRKILTITKN